MTLKRWHWIAILLVTAGLVVMAPSDEGEVAKKGVRTDKAVPKGSANTASISSSDRQAVGENGRVELELLSRIEIQHKAKGRVSDVFNQTSWFVPPTPQPKSLEPPPPLPSYSSPTAPQLPFTYLGRYGDTAIRTVILSKGEKVYTVTMV